MHCVGLAEIPSGTWYCANHDTEEKRERAARMFIKEKVKTPSMSKNTSKPKKWTKAEDKILIDVVITCKGELAANEKKIAKILPGRTIPACRSRYARLRSLDPDLEDRVNEKIRNANENGDILLIKKHKVKTKKKKKKRHKSSYVGVIWNKEKNIWEGIIENKGENKIVTSHENESECASKLREHVQSLINFGIEIDEKYGKEKLKKH